MKSTISTICVLKKLKIPVKNVLPIVLCLHSEYRISKVVKSQKKVLFHSVDILRIFCESFGGWEMVTLVSDTLDTVLLEKNIANLKIDIK